MLKTKARPMTCRECMLLNYGTPLKPEQTCAVCPFREDLDYPFADVDYTEPCHMFVGREDAKPFLGRA